MKNNIPVLIRAIRSSDMAALARFHEKLSERSVYQRYFAFRDLSQRIAPEELRRTCAIDDRQCALVAILRRKTKHDELIGVAEMTKHSWLNEVECALVVQDQYQRLGLGTRMCRCLLEIGRAAGMKSMVSMILHENHAMRAVAKSLGLTQEWELGSHALRASVSF